MYDWTGYVLAIFSVGFGTFLVLVELWQSALVVLQGAYWNVLALCSTRAKNSVRAV